MAKRKNEYVESDIDNLPILLKDNISWETVNASEIWLLIT